MLYVSSLVIVADTAGGQLLSLSFPMNIQQIVFEWSSSFSIFSTFANDLSHMRP